MYFYVKKAHIGKVPGIAEFLAEWNKEGTWGDEGYLTDRGLIPMPSAERRFRIDEPSFVMRPSMSPARSAFSLAFVSGMNSKRIRSRFAGSSQ